MFKLALILALQLGSARGASAQDYAIRARVNPFLDDTPPRLRTPTPKTKRAPYTSKEWEKQLDAWDRSADPKLACQCFTLVVSPAGDVLGSSKACGCGE